MARSAFSVLFIVALNVVVLLELTRAQQQCGSGANGQSCGNGNCYMATAAQARVTAVRDARVNTGNAAPAFLVSVYVNERKHDQDAPANRGSLCRRLERKCCHAGVQKGKGRGCHRDKMMASDGQLQLSNFFVSAVDQETLKGLYNPFMLCGTIVVNNVLASCHSDWFLDSTFDRLGLSHLLPSTYQTVLGPIRMVYKAMGRDAYTRLYNQLDSDLDIVKSGNDFRGYINLLTMTLSPSSYKTTLWRRFHSLLSL